MNKAELIDAVASSADLSKSSATQAVDAVVDTITESLRNGDSVTLVGFGTFEVRDRAARTVVTRRRVQRYRSKPPKPPLLRLAKRLRMP